MKKYLRIFLYFILMSSCSNEIHYRYYFSSKKNNLEILADVKKAVHAKEFTSIIVSMSNMNSVDSVTVFLPISNRFLNFDSTLEGTYIYNCSNFDSLMMNNYIVVSVYLDSKKSSFELSKEEINVDAEIRGH
jgi:hypothetical protein